ncbi:MAG: HAMP domain-containing sensor histidine kinase, partial [Halobacteria archaeon]|nr:HAMP domain-containing sensor histidine kinase [Halobacteria archaeon]
SRLLDPIEAGSIMELGSRGNGLTAFRIALIYIVVGSLWMVFSDPLIDTLFMDPELITRVQTLEDLVFVLVTGVFIYVVIRQKTMSLTASKERMEEQQQQIQVLNRILRHNLRNDMSVILGHAEMIEKENNSNDKDNLNTIKEKVNKLSDLSDKVQKLEKVMSYEEDDMRPIEVIDIIRGEVSEVRRKYDDAEVTTDLPRRAWVDSYPEIESVIANLLENAVEHNDKEVAEIHVSVSRDDGWIEIKVADNGPGIPEQESEVLIEGTETPLYHGSGVGLWLVNNLVKKSGGELTFEDNDPEGCIVSMKIKESTPPE